MKNLLNFKSTMPFNIYGCLMTLLFCLLMTACQKNGMEDLHTEVIENNDTPSMEEEINSKVRPDFNLDYVEITDSLDGKFSESALAAQSRGSNATYTYFSARKSVKRGKWYGYKINKKLMRPGQRYSIKITPKSGDPDLYLYSVHYNSSTQEYKDFRYLRGSERKGLSTENSSAKLYDVGRNENHLYVGVYGFKDAVFDIEINYTYADNCHLATGTGNAKICDYFNSYRPNSISPQSNHWEKFSSSYEDAKVTSAANRTSVLAIKGNLNSITNKGIVNTVLDLGRRYPATNERSDQPTHRIAWDIYVPVNGGGEMNLLVEGRQKGEKISITGNRIIRSIANGAITLMDGTKKYFRIPTKKWVKVELIFNHTSTYIDYRPDTYGLYVNNELVASWGGLSPRNGGHSSTPATGAIEGLAFKGIKGKKYYIDNVCFETDIKRN